MIPKKRKNEVENQKQGSVSSRILDIENHIVS